MLHTPFVAIQLHAIDQQAGITSQPIRGLAGPPIQSHQRRRIARDASSVLPVAAAAIVVMPMRTPLRLRPPQHPGIEVPEQEPPILAHAAEAVVPPVAAPPRIERHGRHPAVVA